VREKIPHAPLCAQALENPSTSGRAPVDGSPVCCIQGTRCGRRRLVGSLCDSRPMLSSDQSHNLLPVCCRREPRRAPSRPSASSIRPERSQDHKNLVCLPLHSSDDIEGRGRHGDARHRCRQTLGLTEVSPQERWPGPLCRCRACCGVEGHPQEGLRAPACPGGRTRRRSQALPRGRGRRR
jgi:hypothetical protein